MRCNKTSHFFYKNRQLDFLTKICKFSISGKKEGNAKIVKLILEKFKGSLLSVLPITAIVIILNFFIPLNTWDFIGFIIGAVMLIVGMTLFTLGADMSMMNVGSGVGKYITKKRKIWIAIVILLIIGILITVA